jgi:hypothetical protein
LSPEDVALATASGDKTRVFAIGGGASTGKTTLAAALAARLGLADVAHVDDLGPALEAEEGPNFIATTPGVWRRPPEWLCEQLVRWTAGLHPHIERAAGGLGDGGIIEGEGIDPRLPLAWRVVYVVETDPVRLHETFATRPGNQRFLALDSAEQRGVVGMNRRYGLWLRDAADAAGQPWIPSQPWATAVDRAMVALGF